MLELMKNTLIAATNSLQKHLQKQPLRCVLQKRCSENIQQIYRRTPMPKCDFNKVAKHLPLEWTPLKHIPCLSPTVRNKDWTIRAIPSKSRGDSCVSINIQKVGKNV